MTAKCVRAESGLEVGKEYEIEYSIIGGWSTDVYVVGYDWPVNSMAFDDNFRKALQKAIDYFNDHYDDYDDTHCVFGGFSFTRDF